MHEIWCALSVRAADGTHVGDELRSVLFAALEAHFPDAVFLLGHVEKMRCDGDITASQHNPGTLDPCCDGVCVAGGVLLDRPVDDLRLGNIREGSQIADALLGLLAHFDRRLASQQSPPPHACGAR